MRIVVDDVNGVYRPVEVGMEYINGKLQFNEVKAEKDKNVPEDKRTMEIVKDIANTIDDMIVMTTDVPSNYDDNKVPMLDTKVWIEDESNLVFFEFYEKPTKNRFVISKSSAMSVKKKIEILSQETFRRLHNTKQEIKWENKVSILNKFMSELKMSGYSEGDRFQILKSGIQRYNGLRKKETDGKRPFYRSRNFNTTEKRREKKEED